MAGVMVAGGCTAARGGCGLGRDSLSAVAAIQRVTRANPFEKANANAAKAMAAGGKNTVATVAVTSATITDVVTNDHMASTAR